MSKLGIYMKYPTLYKKTSTGATQTWYMEVDGAKHRTTSGQLDGKKTTTEWTQCVVTNFLRSNERTPEQQAVFEVEATYKKKLEKDYHTSIDTIDTPVIFQCMLAKEYSDHKHKLKFDKGVYVQPKLDGMRLITRITGMFTRNGKKYASIPHIFSALLPVFEKFPDLILDGEVYNHDYKHDFNTIVSLAKKTKPTEKDLEESKQKIQYHIYDVPSVNGTFLERYHFFYNEIYNLLSTESLEFIKFVHTKQCSNTSEIDTEYSSYIADGYEGMMVRQNDLYENKRSDKLLKYKESMDAEFELVDIEEGLGNWQGYAKRAILKFPDGRRTFSSGIAGSQEQCKAWLENKEQYIGKMTTVVFFNYTPDGIPRFPRVKEFDRGDNT